MISQAVMLMMIGAQMMLIDMVSRLTWCHDRLIRVECDLEDLVRAHTSIWGIANSFLVCGLDHGFLFGSG